MSFIISKQHRGRNFAPHCFLLILSMLLASSLVSQTAPSTTPAAIAAPAIPHLRKQGTATQLIVDDKPFLTLAGELANDSATSLDNMKLVWPKVVQGKLNTVLAGVSWAQLEPEEGKFDFSVVDGIVRGARSHNVHLILLWFASWKNGLSSYPPDWVKKDFERFPRAQIQSGKSLELLTPFSEANRDADAHAFAALMRHVKEIDGRQHTVIMIQVENELGMQGDSRDRSPAANKAFAEPAPRELMDYLQAHKDTLIPEFRQEWEANGSKTSGDWEQVFGQNVATDEIFMAWNFARYIGHVAEAGKSEYPIPMYLNVAVGTAVKKHDVAKTLTQERQEQRGGRFFAVGSALDDLLDVWRAGAPQIDMFSPDSYSDFVEFC
jgi:beta-galactosidase GanA